MVSKGLKRVLKVDLRDSFQRHFMIETALSVVLGHLLYAKFLGQSSSLIGSRLDLREMATLQQQVFMVIPRSSHFRCNMLQSLRVVQFVLQLAVLMLVLFAVYLQSWAVIELHDVTKSSASNRDSQQLSFAPNGYCLRLNSSNLECQPFVHAIMDNLRQFDTQPSTDMDPFRLSTPQDLVITQALSCCHARGDLNWYLQGAQSVLCLVILETVKYALVLWSFFATVCLGLSSLFFPHRFTGCHAFFSWTSTFLGLLVTLIWWYYSNNYIDREHLIELSLNLHHGASYHCVLIAFALAIANAHITFDVTGPASSRKYSRRFIQPTPTNEQGQDSDPLSCPANYLV